MNETLGAAALQLIGVAGDIHQSPSCSKRGVREDVSLTELQEHSSNSVLLKCMKAASFK